MGSRQEYRVVEAANTALKAAVERTKGISLSIHESYLKRLTQQTESTIQLSDTVTKAFTTLKEIARSYKAMLDAIQSVKSISHELKDSFRIEVDAQDLVANQVESVNAASSVELQKAQALKDDLSQIEGIRKFVSEAVESIDEISSRLSLLSMNGRIEAAHAGAYGRGFGVVAQEMLGLQQESQKIIGSEKSQLKNFLPLMSAMQGKSSSVDAQAQSQRESLEAIVTDRANLPPEVRARPESGTWGTRIRVCIGQTDNNPSISNPLSARRGILAVHALDELNNPRSRIQGLNNFLQKACLTMDDLENPKRIDRPLEHATMSCLESFDGDYERCLQESIAHGKLICTFSFGGLFSNGDVLINHFLSTYQRTQQDADKFALLGESLILGLQSHTENGRYWRA